LAGTNVTIFTRAPLPPPGIASWGTSALQSPAIFPPSPAPESPSHSQSLMPPLTASSAVCGE
jgi:hypothetical protein